MAKEKRLTRRELQRILTTKQRHGEDIFRKGGEKGARIRWRGFENPCK